MGEPETSYVESITLDWSALGVALRDANLAIFPGRLETRPLLYRNWESLLKLGSCPGPEVQRKGGRFPPTLTCMFSLSDVRSHGLGVG